MDLKKILDQAQNRGLNGTYAFKIDNEMKDEFFKICLEKDLSTGGVARELIGQFIKSVNEQEQGEAN